MRRPDRVPAMSDAPSVSVIGLGRVGLPLALCFADRGLRVLGIDHDPASSRRCAPGGCRSTSRARRSCWTACAAAAAGAARPRRRGGPRGRHRDHDRHAELLAHRDRPAPGARRDRRPAAAAAPRSRADPALHDRARDDRVRRRLHREATRPAGRRGRVRRARAGADRRRPVPAPRSRRCRASSAASARPRPSVPPTLFGVFGAPIVRTTPVQAELAKIWTNILRYAMFALPNLLMMDCERYGANVFDVIELINHDYPRGGIAHARDDGRNLPAQGLRVLRGALQRARDAARGLTRQRGGAAVPRRGHQAPARRRSPTARSRCSA